MLSDHMAIAIMQPYFFPYIGYFQLIYSVEKFVFYDDVNFINRGWINRNKILINNNAKYLTIPCSNASQNNLILDVEHALDKKKREKLLRKIKFSYGKAPFFDSVYPLVEYVLNLDSKFIADLAISSVKKTSEYLNISTDFTLSSKSYDNRSLGAADRLIDICKKENVDCYINPEGGKELYEKSYFQENGIELMFLEPEAQQYEQFGNEFVPYLSIIDVMMFNDPQKIKKQLLESYSLT